jgi:hypothetical protein
LWLEVVEDDHSEPSDDLDDNPLDLLREVEKMLVLGRALALCVSDESRVDVDSRMAAAESRRAAAMSADLCT